MTYSDNWFGDLSDLTQLGRLTSAGLGLKQALSPVDTPKLRVFQSARIPAF